jgi:broad specificity phosphatase PhoE
MLSLSPAKATTAAVAVLVPLAVLALRRCHSSLPRHEVNRVKLDLERVAAEEGQRAARGDLRLLLFRHGESEANTKPQLICGRSSDTPLSAHGVDQAHLLAKRLRKAGTAFDEVHASTTERAIQTAMCSADEGVFRAEALRVTADVAELSMGCFAGRDRRDAYTPGVLAQIRADSMGFNPGGTEPDGTPGESQREVEQRMHQFATSLIPRAGSATASGEKEKVVGVFGHGLAIRCLLRAVLGGGSTAALHCDCENTSITELRYDSRAGSVHGWKLVRFNDAAHLE